MIVKTEEGIMEGMKSTKLYKTSLFIDIIANLAFIALVILAFYFVLR